MKSQLFKSPLPYLALLIAHIIWGANFVIAKVTLQEFPVMSLGFLRYFFAFILILPFVFLLDKKHRKLKLEHIPKLIAAGIFLVTLNIAFFYEGLIRSEAINASVLSLAIPMLSVLGGWWFLKEKIYFINLTGIALGFLGAIVILGIPLIFFGQGNPQMLLGNSLMFLSNIFVVVGMILSQQLLKDYSSIFVTAALFLIGAVTFFPPAAVEYFTNPGWISHVSIIGLLGFLYITILSSICAYFFLIWGMAKTDVVQANLFQYLEPAVAATLAVPFLGERISYSFIVGTILVALGVYWGTLGKAHHYHSLHKPHRS